MNPALVRYIFLAYSFKNELKYVLLTFLLVLSLPFIAVFTITHTGIQVVSDTLVELNVQTNTIQLYYPNGTPYKTLQINTQWPVKGAITADFGDVTPFQLFHSGLDIANEHGHIGAAIYPAMPGKVSHVGNLPWGFGKHVIVDHGDNITTVYAHLDTVKVNEEDEVGYNTVLGTEGETGWATGPHLHFEVRVWGIPVNPGVFLGQ